MMPKFMRFQFSMTHEREMMLRRKQTGSMSLIFSPLSDLAFSQQIPTSVMGYLCLGHLDGCLFSSATSQQGHSWTLGARCARDNGLESWGGLPNDHYVNMPNSQSTIFHQISDKGSVQSEWTGFKLRCVALSWLSYVNVGGMGHGCSSLVVRLGSQIVSKAITANGLYFASIDGLLFLGTPGDQFGA